MAGAGDFTALLILEDGSEDPLGGWLVRQFHLTQITAEMNGTHGSAVTTDLGLAKLLKEDGDWRTRSDGKGFASLRRCGIRNDRRTHVKM